MSGGDTLDSNSAIRTYYELQPVFPVSAWWQTGLLLLATVALIVFATWMVWRDARSLPVPVVWALLVLRLFAISCVLLYFLNPGQRSESQLIANSRLAVLIDTSLSMGLPASELEVDEGKNPIGDSSDSREKVSRIDVVRRWAENGSQIQQLRSQHDISIYTFGENDAPIPILSLPKLASLEKRNSAADLSTESIKAHASAWIWLFRIGVYVFATVALGSLAIYVFHLLTGQDLKPDSQKNGKDLGGASTSWYLLASVISGLLAVVFLGVVGLKNPKLSIAQAMNWQPVDVSDFTAPEPVLDDSKNAAPLLPSVIDWATELLPRGAATSLGAAIQSIVNQERGGPLAGIVVVTDGQSNAGLPVATAIAAAENAGVPIFPVGVGSTEMLQNVSLTDLQAPLRVLPGDEFKVKAVIKSFGFSNRQVNVQVFSAPAEGDSSAEEGVGDPSLAEAEQLDAEMTVTLEADGNLLPIEFDLKSEGEGKRRYIVKIESLERDADRDDNVRTAVVESIQRDTKVLLIAGGPNREFRFLRNQLYRDKNVNLDVWLQTAKIGADQESDQLLFEFPQTTEELFEYDCVIAFDPDWRSLSAEQTQMLERWVAENAGGLILIAGPVNTPEWTRRPRGDEAIDKIRGLYPVSFFNQGTAQLKLGRFGGSQPFPLEFSRAGRAARHLWLGDSGADSVATWGQFEGVFGYYAVNEAKAGADVLASFSDESTAMNGDYPIYLASQFYGAGRVFFSGQWRNVASASFGCRILRGLLQPSDSLGDAGTFVA